MKEFISGFLYTIIAYGTPLILCSLGGMMTGLSGRFNLGMEGMMLFAAFFAQGRLIGGQAWYDPDLNSQVDLAAGKLTIDYDYTPCAPAEAITLNQRITDRFYAGFADALSN